jgi:hypothetical protein
MIQTCGIHYNYDGEAKKNSCGKTFDDAARMTMCPHPRLDDPNWREKIVAYMRTVGYDWNQEQFRFVKRFSA